MSGVHWAIEWRHVESGDVGLRGEKPQTGMTICTETFPDRQSAANEAARLNERQLIYHYRAVQTSDCKPGLKLKGVTV